MKPVLQLSNVTKRFGPTVALDGVDLKLFSGRILALIGENGAGKTTLMSILAGILPPDSGDIELEGKPYLPGSPIEAREHGISLIHQELSLFPHLTVSENILMGVESSRKGLLDHKECQRRTLQVLGIFSHPEIQPHSRVADLPVAARQIVEICRAIASDARIILMDEPTSSLQQDDVGRLFTLIRRMRDRGLGVVYISHFLEEVREVADDCAVLRDGKRVFEGELQSATDDELVAHMVGRPVKNLFPTRARPERGPLALQVQGLSAPPSLKEASFELRRGEVLGIAGLVGSGRTQLVRALFGLSPSDSGAVLIGDQRIAVSKADPYLRILQGIGYLSEDRKGEGIALRLSIADNVTLSRLSRCARLGWLSLDCQGKETRKWITRLDIRARDPFHPTQTLSGGNQQKVALARLLHQQAEVLLLDEPTRGIDIGSKVRIYKSIAECAAEGKAVLMVSSYLPELFGVCDRIAVMRRGRLSSSRPVAEWTPESVMQTAIAGEQ